MNVEDALYHTAHDFPGGVPALAIRMGCSQNVLNKKVNPQVDTHKPTLRESVNIQTLSNDFRVLQAMAHELNHVALQLPVDIELGDMGLLDAYLQTAEANGQLSIDFRVAWADGSISRAEFNKLKDDTHELIAKQLAFLAEIERVVKE
jgi:hypothetical protein